jgi:L-malate glycosyltransferase
MKRILFYESRPEWGGAQKCELDLLLSIEDSSVKTYFLSSTDGPMVRRVKDAGREPIIIPIKDSVNKIRKEHVNTGAIFLFQQLLSMVPHLLGLVFFVIRNKIDVVYTSQFRSQLIIGWIAKLLGRKVIWHIHGEEQLNNLLGKLSVKTADKIIVVSNSLCKTYINLFPKDNSKFKVVLNGVEVKIDELKRENEIFTISLVGALVEGKRQDLAIIACSKLIKMGYDVHLNIIGEKPPWHSDEYKHFLLSLVNKEDIAKSVTFTGWVENPSDYLINSHVFILPSETEGLPLSIIEAMALSLPCISTNVGGVTELIENDETGFVINVNAIDELTEKLKILMDNPILCEKLGQKGRERYVTHFTKKAFVKGVVEVINTVK